jgi:hypothetical protein
MNERAAAIISLFDSNENSYLKTASSLIQHFHSGHKIAQFSWPIQFELGHDWLIVENSFIDKAFHIRMQP